LLGRVLITRNQFLEAVDTMHTMGPENVILSLGSRGAIAVREGVFECCRRVWTWCLPSVRGDALSAAFVWSMEKKNRSTESLRWGVAGNRIRQTTGLNFAPFDQTRAMFKLWKCGHRVRAAATS